MKNLAIAVAALTLLSALGRAQNAAESSTPAPRPPEHFYRMNFTLEELNDTGKVINTRSYLETVDTSFSTQQIRTGSRIPIATGAENGSTQFQYVDVGVNFDIRQVKETGDKLQFVLVAEVSSLAPQPNGQSSALASDPVIRQNKWDSMVMIPIGKPTVVFSADNLEDKGKMQVQLTATPVE